MTIKSKMISGKIYLRKVAKSQQQAVVQRVGRPRAVYTFELPLGVSPLVIRVNLPRTNAKDYVLVPDEKLLDSSELLENLPVSGELKQPYVYSAGTETLIVVADEKSPFNRELREFQISIIRWKIGFGFQFPKQILCEAIMSSNNGCDFAKIIVPSTKKEVILK